MARLHVRGLPSPLRRVHVMGIGGTAMGTLAGMLVDEGLEVTGSDQGLYPPMSEVLRELGVPVFEGFRAENLAHHPDLVVVGNVVRPVYEEARALLESDLDFCSFPHLLAERFLAGTRPLVVAGTHGKTTTTALAAWVLERAGRAPGWLVGGVVPGLGRSGRACRAPEGAPRHFVVEGDEYDTAFFDKRPKFLHYRPQLAVLTSIEFDHADIYPDLDAVRSAFRSFVRLLPEDGCLVAWGGSAEVRAVAREARCPVRFYGLEPDLPWSGRILEVDPAEGRMRFEVRHRGRPYGTFRSLLVGEHNLLDQLAVIAALDHEGLSPAELARGIESFEGVARRQQVLGTVGGVTVVDDFAHHPTAVRVTLEALKLRFGGRRLWAVFEPRSNTSRRRVFQEDYARAFDAADLVVVAARGRRDEAPESELLDPELLARELLARGIEAQYLPEVDEIAAVVAANAMPADVVAVLSNGGFGGLHGKLLAALERRFGSTGPGSDALPAPPRAGKVEP